MLFRGDRLHTEPVFRVNGIKKYVHRYEKATKIFQGDRHYISGRADKNECSLK
jgi:hypothetical protein